VYPASLLEGARNVDGYREMDGVVDPVAHGELKSGPRQVRPQRRAELGTGLSHL
jgi:hypothetical protein